MIMAKRMDLVADVASYQPDSLAFMQALKAAGVKAVIVKLTEGSNPGSAYLNPKAQNQINNARAAGLLVHAYHYARYNGIEDAKAEAKWFVECARKLGIGSESVMVVDVEDRVLQYDTTPDSNAFLQYVKDAGYPHVDFYTSTSWVKAGRVNRDQLIAKNLWIASYGVSQPGVDNVGMWQFTSTFPVFGLQMDMSYDFTGFYSEPKTGNNNQPQQPSNPAPAPKPAAPQASGKWVDALGDTWYNEKGKFKLNSAIKLRYGAKTTSNVLATLPAGSVVSYDAYSFHNGYVWLRQPRGNGQYAYIASGEEVNGKRTSSWGTFSE